MDASQFETKSRTINAKKVEENKTLQGTLTVKGVTTGEKDIANKLVLVFEETEEELVLNKTNLKTMIQAKGKDTDRWQDAQITLAVVPSQYAGQPTKSVLICKVV